MLGGINSMCFLQRGGCTPVVLTRIYTYLFIYISKGRPRASNLHIHLSLSQASFRMFGGTNWRVGGVFGLVVSGIYAYTLVFTSISSYLLGPI